MKTAIDVDIERLRADLEDYYGTGAFSGIPAMMSEVWDMARKPDEDVIRIARREGFDLYQYRM